MTGAADGVEVGDVVAESVGAVLDESFGEAVDVTSAVDSPGAEIADGAEAVVAARAILVPPRAIAAAATPTTMKTLFLFMVFSSKRCACERRWRECVRSALKPD